MGNLLRAPNGNGIVLIQRAGSHSLAIAAISTFWPDTVVDPMYHPAYSFPLDQQFSWTGDQPEVALIVRNPLERFRSICAHKPNRTLEEHLEKPIYGPLPFGNYVRYFRFEDQLEECAEWLGLPTLLPHEDASDPALKPNLTIEQENIVRQIYADDFILWESLNNKGG